MRFPFDPRPRLFPLLLVVAAVILVPAIAFASTPDPFWLEGVYDDVDGDDLLSLIDDIVATEAACLPHTSPPHFYKAAFTLRPSMTSSHAANRFTRGPPLRLVYMPSSLPIALLDQPMSSRASGRDRQQLTASSTRTKVRSNSKLLTEGRVPWPGRRESPPKPGVRRRRGSSAPRSRSRTSQITSSSS